MMWDMHGMGWNVGILYILLLLFLLSGTAAFIKYLLKK